MQAQCADNESVRVEFFEKTRKSCAKILRFQKLLLTLHLDWSLYADVAQLARAADL